MDDQISKAFRRELIGYLMALYFPLMFGIVIVVYELNLIEIVDVDILFLLTIVLPAGLVALGVLLKFRFVYKIQYKPKLKSLALFLTVTSLVVVLSDTISFFFVQKLNYSHLAIFIGSYALYRISDGKADKKTVANFLIVTSLLFLIINTLFALIFRSMLYATISILWLATLIGAMIFIRKFMSENDT